MAEPDLTLSLEENMDDLISVVVPIYNVEHDLPRCLESIEQQTYASLEVVLVDDGSTDDSGSIADEFARQHDRYVCVHTQNAGLSAARDEGMRYMHGAYVVFVDSDDYIGPRHIENLHNAVIREHALVAVTGFTTVSETEPSNREGIVPSSARSFSDEEAIDQSLRGKLFASHAWGKMYAKKLFPLLEYPIGRKYEDQFVTYKVFAAAGKIAYEDANDYYYVTDRNGSISNENPLNRMDFIDALREERLFLNDRYGRSFSSLEDLYCEAIMLVYIIGKRDDGFRNQVDPYFKEIRRYCSTALSKTSKVSKRTKTKYAIALLGKSLFDLIVCHKA